MSHIITNHGPPLAVYLCLVLNKINPDHLPTLHYKLDSEPVLVGKDFFALSDTLHRLTRTIILREQVSSNSCETYGTGVTPSCDSGVGLGGPDGVRVGVIVGVGVDGCRR